MTETTGPAALPAQPPVASPGQTGLRSPGAGSRVHWPRPGVPNGWYAGPPGDPDRYELLGEGLPGGEGVLWKARYQGRLQTPITFAVKVLRRPAGTAPGWPSAADRQRWQDQAALLRHLNLPHMVRLHEVFAGPPPHLGTGSIPETHHQHVAYAVMEWVDGPTLAQVAGGMPATRESIADRLEYVAQAARALAALHSRTSSAGNSLLHRDVKPGNCIVSPGQGIVLVGLSTLRLLGDGSDPAGPHSPGYAAPEVLAAPHTPPTPSADLYSLGALAAFCLLGTDPPATPAGPALREQLQATATHAAARAPDVLAALILAMLDPDPHARPRDLLLWARHLQSAGAPAQHRARTRHPGALAAALLLTTTGAAIA
jgi:serine/threonine protein kinase